MAHVADDASMDAVQRRLMFEDECILVDEHDNVVGHLSKYNSTLFIWNLDSFRKISKGLEMLHKGSYWVNSEYLLKMYQSMKSFRSGACFNKAPFEEKWGEHELDYLLFIVRDVKLLPNPDEVADVKYVNRDQLKELLKKADAGEDDVKLSPWFMDWWEHVEKGCLPMLTDLETIHKLV